MAFRFLATPSTGIMAASFYGISNQCKWPKEPTIDAFANNLIAGSFAASAAAVIYSFLPPFITAPLTMILVSQSIRNVSYYRFEHPELVKNVHWHYLENEHGFEFNRRCECGEPPNKNDF